MSHPVGFNANVKINFNDTNASNVSAGQSLAYFMAHKASAGAGTQSAHCSDKRNGILLQRKTVSLFGAVQIIRELYVGGRSAVDKNFKRKP